MLSLIRYFYLRLRFLGEVSVRIGLVYPELVIIKMNEELNEGSSTNNLTFSDQISERHRMH